MIINSKKNINELLKIDGGKFSVNSLDEAYKFCESFTKSHYENFPVGSIFIPKNLRKHFYSIYVFSRLADDISDELLDETSETKILMLNKLLNLIKNPQTSDSNNFNPLIYALQNTIKEKKLPLSPFEKLIKAFEIDSNFKQVNTMEDNLNYCQFSANPVGELVLRLFDNYNDDTIKYSDSICTGLQLVNFWQDISRDYKINRIYIPKDLLKKYEIDDLYKNNLNNLKNFDDCCKEIYDYTENLFTFGIELVKFIKNKRLKLELAVKIEGGKRILHKTRILKSRILYERPKLNFVDWIIIFYKAILLI